MKTDPNPSFAFLSRLFDRCFLLLLFRASSCAFGGGGGGLVIACGEESSEEISFRICARRCREGFCCSGGGFGGVICHVVYGAAAGREPRLACVGALPALVVLVLLVKGLTDGVAGWG